MRHRRRRWHSRARLWLLTLLLAAGLVGQRPVPAASQALTTPEPVVLRADAAGIVLEWRAPALSLRREIGDDGHAYSVLEAPGWPKTDKPGQPRLPFASKLAAVPPSGDVVVHLRAIEQADRPLHYPIAPARTPVIVGTPPTGIEWDWALDEQVYTKVEVYPADVVTVEEVGWLRGHRLVRLTFYPVRVDSAQGALEITDYVRAELAFEGQPFDGAHEEASIQSRWGRDDPLTPALQKNVVNPAQVIQFTRPEQSVSALKAHLSTSQLVSADPSSVTPSIMPELTPPSPPAGADYVIIAHSDFINAVAPLATHRAVNDGLRVFSTTVEAIYDAYPGYTDYEAIKEYIYDAYHNWTPPALSYVLLVGDGIRDSTIHSQQIGAVQTFIPPYPLTMYPLWCRTNPNCKPWEAASDNRFATMDGEDDYLADVFIGRLPVNTVDEATTVVQKITDYELHPPQWPWNERVLFFAGNELDAPYHRYSDEVYDEHVFAGSNWRRVYFCTSNCNEPHLYDNINTARERTVQELTVGGLLASYVGHSSWHQWAADPVTLAPMFHLDNVVSLDNSGALPIFLQMTCHTSDFSEPTGDTLDETLLRHTGGGAVATWGPTTLGLSLGHNVLHQGFFGAVFPEDTDTVESVELWEAILAAKLELIASDNAPYYLDLLDTFVLLGDPAMDLNLDIVPWAHGVFLPLTIRGN